MSNRTTLTEAEAAFVQAQKAARLATADADGHPYIVPVCYAFDGTRFYTPLDEKPKRVNESRLQRVRNIEARHEAALLIDQYDDDWSHLGYVLVRGRAELLQPEEPFPTRPSILRRQRCIQSERMPLDTHAVIV